MAAGLWRRIFIDLSGKLLRRKIPKGLVLSAHVLDAGRYALSGGCRLVRRDVGLLFPGFKLSPLQVLLGHRAFISILRRFLFIRRGRSYSDCPLVIPRNDLYCFDCPQFSAGLSQAIPQRPGVGPE